MSDRRLRAALAAVALAGAAVAGYLTWVRWTGATVACSTGGCATVQSSEYAEVAGIPVPILGLGAFLAIAATALRASEPVRLTGAALALAGVGFSGYLLVVQLAVLDAVCDWCLASDALVTLAAVAALLRLRTSSM